MEAGKIMIYREKSIAVLEHIRKKVMGWKNELVPEEIYERYEFPLPLLKIFGHQRRTYLFTELLKRHPCFSDEYCYDLKIKPSKRGLLADLIVMSRLSYARFRNNLGKAAFLGLKLENIRGRRFVRPGLAVYWGSGIILVALISMLLSRGFLDRGLDGKEMGNVTGNELRGAGGLYSEKVLPGEVEGPEMEGELTGGAALTGDTALTGNALIRDTSPRGEAVWAAGVALPGATSLPESSPLFSTFLHLFSGREEAVLSFDWASDGGYEKISLSLEGIYPEELYQGFKNSELQLSSLSYRNGRPYLKADIHCRKVIYKLEEVDYLDDARALIRQHLLKEACQIRLESGQPYCLSFSFSGDGKRLFEGLGNILMEKGLFPLHVKIGREEGGAFEVELKIMKEEGSGRRNCLLELADSNFFASHGQKSPLNVKSAPQKKAGTIPALKNKVGEVIKENGERVIYYKNDKGKMESLILKEGL